MAFLPGHPGSVAANAAWKSTGTTLRSTFDVRRPMAHCSVSLRNAVALGMHLDLKDGKCCCAVMLMVVVVTVVVVVVIAVVAVAVVWSCFWWLGKLPQHQFLLLVTLSTSHLAE